MLSSRPRRAVVGETPVAHEAARVRRTAQRALPRSWVGVRGVLTGAGVIAVVITSGAWVDLTAQAVGVSTPAPTQAATLEAQLKPTVTVMPRASSAAATPKPVTHTARPAAKTVMTSPALKNTCKASFYDEPQMTASGERFNPEAFTAAHKTLPLGSKVKVANPQTGKTVVVRINDRGPYAGGRCLDLSRAAMRAIGGLDAGVLTVKWERL